MLIGILLFNILPILLTIAGVSRGLPGSYILAIILDILATVILIDKWDTVWEGKD